MNKGFNKNTEVLTYNGWVPIDKVTVNTKIISYNKEIGLLEKDTVEEISCSVGRQIQVTNKFNSFNCGLDQVWCGTKRMWAKKGCPRPTIPLTFTIPEASSECNITCSARYHDNKASSYSKDDATFLAWLLSDGYYSWSDLGEGTSDSFGKRRGIIGIIAQAEHKFFQEVESVLDNVGINYSKWVDEKNHGKPVFKYHLKAEPLRKWMDEHILERESKDCINWSRYLLEWDSDTIREFLYHFWLADGKSKGMEFLTSPETIIYQNKGLISDAVQIAMFLQGGKLTVTPHDNYSTCENLHLSQKSHITMQRTSITELPEDYLYSLKTNNDTYVIRQPKMMSITHSSF